MRVRHDDDELAQAESDPAYKGGLDQDLVCAFRDKMQIVRAVANETELYQWKSLHFEKLKGKRSHERSIRLTKKWRLILEIEPRDGANNNICVIKKIEDYH